MDNQYGSDTPEKETHELLQLQTVEGALVIESIPDGIALNITLTIGKKQIELNVPRSEVHDLGVWLMERAADL